MTKVLASTERIGSEGPSDQAKTASLPKVDPTLMQTFFAFGDVGVSLPAIPISLDTSPPPLDQESRQALQYLLRMTPDESPQKLINSLIRPKPINTTMDAATASLLSLMDAACTPHTRNSDPSPVNLSEQVKGSRPIYNGSCGQDSLILAMQNMADSSVFMPSFRLPQELQSAGGANSYSLDLNFPEMSEVRSKCAKALDGATILLPYLAEPETAHLNYAHALEFTSPDKVFAISARGESLTANRISREISVPTQIISQQAVLACINWERVCEEVGIPFHYGEGHKILPPSGTKGLTVLAGLLLLHGSGELRTNAKVIVSDTDFIFPKHNDGITYLGMPLAYNSKGYQPEMVMIAKTGSGRNNEQWVKTIDALANDRSLPFHLRQVALFSASYVWPLAGNRLLNGEHLYRMPIATSMGFETMINLYMAAMQIEHDRQIICQVANPGPVIENGFVDPVREHSHIDRCAQFAQNLIRLCHHESTRPNMLSLDALREFNRLHGNPYFMMIQAESHAPNKATGYQQDFILPSIEQMQNMGVIDFKKLAELKRG